MARRHTTRLQCAWVAIVALAGIAASPPNQKTNGAPGSAGIVQPLRPLKSARSKSDGKPGVPAPHLSSAHEQRSAGQSGSGTTPLLRTPDAAEFGFLTKSSKHPQLRSQSPASPADAATPEIALDGTLGPSGPLSASGGIYTITSDMGQTHGSNLFQSFSQFNLNAGETASFAGPSSIQNVLARVTGGSASNINGTLQCIIPSADFYLINPAGVIFGPSAALDVKGSFAVTTANVVKLSDGGQFNAAGSPGNLTSAPPSAFGFLSSAPAAVQVQGSSLTVGMGQTIAILAGSIQLQGATLTAPGGRVTLAAAAPQEQLSFTGSSINSDVQGNGAGGAISITGQSDPVQGTNASTINVDGDGGGRVFIRGSNVTLQDSSISAKTTGFTDGSGVSVNASGTLGLIGSTIDTSTSGAGNAGSIDISAASMVMDGRQAPAQLIAETSANPIPAIMSVTIDLDHPSVADLNLGLTSPSGTFVNLTPFEGLSGANLSGTTFDDRSPANIAAAAAPYAGTFLPASPLGIFTGQPATGTWTLSIDNNGTSTGTLKGWSMLIGTQRFVAPDTPVTVAGVTRTSSSLLVNSTGLTVPASGTAHGGDIRIDAGSVTIMGATLLSAASRTVAGFGPPADPHRPEPLGAGPPGMVHVAPTSITFDSLPAQLSLDSNGVGQFVPIMPQASNVQLSGSTVEQPSPGAFVVTAESGQQQQSNSATNLFFTFSHFDIASGDSLAFMPPATPPNFPVQNVFARIIGGTPSFINGTIENRITGANLYVLNPAGIVFGPRGTLDLTGSFAASTSDLIRFSDGTTFGSGTLAAPSGASVVGFTFTAHAPAPLIVQGSTLTLSGSMNQVLSFVGGAVDVLDGTITGQQFIDASQSRVNIVSVASPGTAVFNPSDLSAQMDTTTFRQLGPITISNNSSVGNSIVVLQGDSVSLSAGAVLAGQGLTTANGFSGVDIMARGALTLDASLIAAGIGGQQQFVQAQQLASALNLSIGGPLVMHQSSIRATSLSSGGPPAGQLSAKSMDLVGSSLEGGFTLGFAGVPAAIGLQVNAMSFVTLDAQSRIGTRTAISPPSGLLGSVDLSAGSLNLQGGAVEAYAKGHAGDVSVRTSGPIEISQGGFIGSDSASVAGHAGTVDVDASAISLNNATIESAGNTISGDVVVTVFAGSLSMTSANISALVDSNEQAGRAGNVIVNVSGSANMSAGSKIVSGQNGLREPAGTVSVTANTLTVDNSTIASVGVLPNTEPTVALTVSNQFAALNGAIVTADSFNQNNPGSVVIKGSAITLDGNSSITARSFVGDGGGKVDVQAGNGLVRLLHGSVISASSFGSSTQGASGASPGTVVVSAGQVELDSGSSVTATGGGGLATPLSVTVDGTTYSDSGFEPIGFLSQFVAADLNGTWKLEAASGSNEFDLVSPAGTRVELEPLAPKGVGSWSLSLNGKLIGQSLSPVSGTDFSSALTVAGATPGITSAAGGTVNIIAQALKVNASSISTTTLGTGAAGNVTVNAGTVALLGGSTIDSAARPPPGGGTATGNAGSVSVTVTGPLSMESSSSVTTTSALSAGGDITISAPSVTLTNASNISANALQAGRITITTPSLSLSGVSVISTNTKQAPPVTSNLSVNTSALSLDNSIISATTSGSGTGGDVQINPMSATSPLAVSLNNGSTISAEAIQGSSGAGGSIVITPTMFSASDSKITASSAASGGAGSISLLSSGLVSLVSGSSLTTTATQSTGGDITVSAPSVVLSGASSISADALRAGGITITTPSLVLSGGSSISTNTTLAPVLNSNLSINTSKLALDDSRITATTDGSGKGGDVEIKPFATGGPLSVAMTNGSAVSASSSGAGDAGSVGIFATGEVALTNSSISAQTDGVAADNRGGDISISADKLVMDGGTVLASAGGQGIGGDISVNATNVSLKNKSLISTDTVLSDPLHPSNVTIAATNLSLSDSTISASSTGTGDGGGVIVMADDRVTIGGGSAVSATAANAAGGDITIRSSSFSLTNSGGNQQGVFTDAKEGGKITIDANRKDLLVSNGRVSATTTEQEGGDVTLAADKGNLFLYDALVSAKAFNKGNITLDAADRTFIQSSTVTARATNSGGEISIDPQYLLLSQSAIDGRSGPHQVNVKVQVGAQVTFIPSGNSQILSNNVSLPPETDVAAALVGLPSATPQTVVQLAPVCAPRLEGNFSSFVVTGRGGRPPQPGGWVPDLLLGDGTGGNDQSPVSQDKRQ